MDEKTIFDTVESIIETRLAPIENQLIEKEQKNRERRCKEYNKNQLKEKDRFVKHYLEGSVDLLELKKQKILSSSDIGKFSLLCMFLQKDTGKIVHPETNKPMNKTQMRKELNEHKQHFGESFDKLLSVNLVMKKQVGNSEEYYINPKYAFNGESRLMNCVYVNVNVNNCNNVTINPNINQVQNLM